MLEPDEPELRGTFFYPLYKWGSHLTRMQITNGPEHMKPCVHAFFHVKRR